MGLSAQVAMIVVDYGNLIPQTLYIVIMGSLLYSLFNFTFNE